MLRWGILVLTLVLIGMVLSFGDQTGMPTGTAKVVFVIGVVMFLVSLFTGRRRR